MNRQRAVLDDRIEVGRFDDTDPVHQGHEIFIFLDIVIVFAVRIKRLYEIEWLQFYLDDRREGGRRHLQFDPDTAHPETTVRCGGDSRRRIRRPANNWLLKRHTTGSPGADLRLNCGTA